jgi:hydroxymethylpyrimidine/phosphomethylpyrimidine kinase
VEENVQRSTSKAQRRIQSPPVALTIAGSDSSAGAGIQADLKTFSALGVYGLTAVTCVVAETPGKVSRIEPVNAEVVRLQIEVVAKSFPIRAMKTGLLRSARIISAVADAIHAIGLWSAERPAKSAAEVPLVVDPVMISTSGDQLLEPDAIEAYETRLFPLARLITPNLDEAAQLLGEKVPDRASMAGAARALSEKYGVATLLKGGHLAGDQAFDLLFTAGKATEFAAPFVQGVATHGTGCTYSAAITAGLASGLALEEAIGRAKQFVTASIVQRFRWRADRGRNLDALNHAL